MNRRPLLLFWCFLALPGLGVGLAGDPPVLRILADDDLAPLSSWNSEKEAYEGIAVDLFREVAARLNLKYEWVHDSRPWSLKVESFRAGDADVLVPSPSVFEGWGTASTPFYPSREAVIAPESASRTLLASADLAALTVGVVDGYEGAPVLASVAPGAKVVTFPSAQDLYQALRIRRVDVGLESLAVFRESRYGQDLFDLVIVHTIPEVSFGYGFLFRDGLSQDLVSRVDKTLATLDPSGLVSRYERGAEELILKYAAQTHLQHLIMVLLFCALVVLVLLSLVLGNRRRLRESEVRFRALSEASFGGISVHRDGVILECNQGLAEMTGYPRSELLGMDGVLLIAPPFRDLVLENIRSDFRETYEVDGLRKDGSTFPLAIRGKSIPYQGGPARVTEFHDLTDRKDAEAETRKAKRQYDELVRKIPIGIYQLRGWPHGEFRFEFASPRMADLLGTTVEAIKADPWAAFGAIHPEDRPAFEERNRIALAAGAPFDWTGRCVRGGQTRWFHIASEPEEQPDGDALWSGTVVDITEVRQAQERVSELLQEKDLILREVHHRIKNNMGTVSGLLTLQAATLEDPAAIAALEDAKGRILSMMVLYDKLYLAAGKQAMSLSEYLPALVDQILSHFPNNAWVTHETIVDDIVVDSRALSSLGIIVNELLTNAMKYAFQNREKGSIVVRATQTGSRVTVTVTDDGVGMDVEDAQRSSGFGLSLVDMLAQHLRATVTRSGDQGTCVSVEFPV